MITYRSRDLGLPAANANLGLKTLSPVNSSQQLASRMMTVQTSMRMALPQEIWWLVSQEFTSRRDFASLFSCALVSHSLASMALPLLYRYVPLQEYTSEGWALLTSSEAFMSNLLLAQEIRLYLTWVNGPACGDRSSCPAIRGLSILTASGLRR
jgi:hypothetical protein